ncbi:MAG: U32 family peptidase, partial [Oscillospiraceae bacterium]
VFVHGALCMCISGQCYLSAMLGGRSGNRGNCAQPCRLPFKIGENKNALSLKDLSLINELGELKKIGVSSVKIEGRMKRPEYVAAAVTAVKASFEGKTANMEELQKIFSRSGFTKGYYDSRRDINMFGIRQKEDVVSAKDVLSSLGHLAEIEIPRVPLFGEFSALENQPMTLTVSDSKANSVTVEGDIPEEAHTRSTDVEHVVASLSKTGGTPYFFDDIETEIGENLMIKISQLNSLRRESLEKLGEKRREITPKPFENILPQTFPAERLSKFFIRVRCDERQLSPDIIKLADEILIPYNQYEALLRLKCDKEKIVLEIPRVMFDNESTVRREINGAKSLGITKVWVGNIGSLRPCQEEGMIINAGWSLNLANNYATDLLRCEGAVTAEISPEIMLTQAECINSVNMGIIAYGYLPLMTFRNCPVKANL